VSYLTLLHALQWFWQWLPRAYIFGDHANLVGLIWLSVLFYLFYFRYRDSGVYRGWRILMPITKAFLTAWLFQIGIDEFITMPLNLASGSWSLIQPSVGQFSFYLLVRFKLDVYTQIVIVVWSLLITDCFSHFQLTKNSLFWLSTVLVMQCFLSFGLHWWNYRNLAEPMYNFVFWASYPLFRVLTGFFASATIKKAEDFK